MKKQLLIAAVAATMATASIADVSITGSGKLNYTNTDTQNADSTNAFSTDLVLGIVGKSGDTSVVFKQEFNDNSGTAAMDTKNAYMASKIAGVNVKAGSWFSADSLLGNGSRGNGRFSADYTIEGIKLQYENQNSGDESVTISGDVAGVSISHEMFQNDDTDTKISGSFGGVNVAYRNVDSDTVNSNKDSLEVSTTMNGITATYAQVDVDGTGTTTSDAFFGETTIAEASGISLSTAVAGNTVTLKSYDIEASGVAGAADDSYTKIIVTRPLDSGATFEMTYTDKDDAGSADVETLDLELSVKF